MSESKQISFADILATGCCPHCEAQLHAGAQPGDECKECGEMYYDLIEHFYAQPEELKAVMDFYVEQFEDCDVNSYQLCRDLLAAVEAIGYTLDYDLSGTCFGLKLKSKDDVSSAVNLAESIIASVKADETLVNERLLSVIKKAESMLPINQAEALGMLATIAPLHGNGVSVNDKEFKGFAGPENIASMSDELRNRLRMEEAPGIDVYARLMSDHSYNYVLVQHEHATASQSNEIYFYIAGVAGLYGTLSGNSHSIIYVATRLGHAEFIDTLESSSLVGYEHDGPLLAGVKKVATVPHIDVFFSKASDAKLLGLIAENRISEVDMLKAISRGG